MFLTSILSRSSVLRLQHINRIVMSNTEIKRLKSDVSGKKIGTHDGIFHCDEVLACYMLKTLPEYEDAEIIRTRNKDLLATCDIVVDVGGEFNPETLRFDHHQATFNDTLTTLKPEHGKSWSIRLSSAGLIYTFYGEAVIRNILKSQKNYDIPQDALSVIFPKIYGQFIREIDGIDNGVPMFDGEPSYSIHSHLSGRVSNFNPAWNEADVDVPSRFEDALKLVGSELCDKIFYYTFNWWPARAIVEEAVKSRLDIHSSGEILELKQFAPWKHHLAELEVCHGIAGIPKYVIMENKPNDWRVICVPNTPDSFVCRKFLHKKWRGIRDEELAALSGISDIGFCHATGFIGGAKTREAVLQMAIQSLEGDYID